MLNAVSWAKRYNTFQTHDPTLKPAIVYLTMENTNEETIKRLWGHCFGDNIELANYSPVEAAAMFEKAGIFTPNDPNDAELLIWYRANRSINTADLNGLLEDLKKEGKECVFLVLDYLRRIRSTETNKDLRLELSNATNELKTIALEQDIPILTGSQINREGIRVIEEAGTFEEKIRASEKISAANVGESIDIVQNADYVFAINRIENRQCNEAGELEINDRYLSIKLIACRTKQPNIISFKHRFADGNGMKLLEDVNLPKALSTLNDNEFLQGKTSGIPKTGGKRRVV